MEVEDQIQFTHIPKISVQHLHKVMHQLQSDQLIITAVNAHDKVKTGIALVHHLQHAERLPTADMLVNTAVNAHDKVQTGIALVYHLQHVECLPTADTLNNSRYSAACDDNNLNGTQRIGSCKAYGRANKDISGGW